MNRTILLFAGLALGSSAVRADEPVSFKNFKAPADNRKDEPLAGKFSLMKAAHFIDSEALHWTKSHGCFSCHSNLTYLYARPTIPGPAPAHAEIRQALEELVSKRWKEKGPRWDTEVVVAAAALAYNDAATTGKLHPLTRTALDRMWTVQRKDGGFSWYKCNLPPMEIDDHYGATLAVVAAGVAPAGYAKTEAARKGLDGIRRYLKANPPRNLHHKAMLLWSTSYVDDIVTDDSRQAAIKELRDPAARRRLVGGGPGQLEARRQTATGPDRERRLRHGLRGVRPPPRRCRGERPGVAEGRRLAQGQPAGERPVVHALAEPGRHALPVARGQLVCGHGAGGVRGEVTRPCLRLRPQAMDRGIRPCPPPAGVNVNKRSGLPMTNGRTALHRAWEFFGQTRRISVIDLLLVVGLVGLVVGLARLGSEAVRPLGKSAAIDVNDPWLLPLYTFFSLSRGLIAYCLSLGFTLVYGYWAAKDAVAAKVLVPLLDILQSIPVLSFLPGLVLGLVYLFPGTNLGLELAAILMIFTGQAWNMTFSFYHSLRCVPPDLRDLATVYRFGWWRRLRWIELPYATMGLVWNSMMSMAGGWFFLMIAEAFELHERDFRLPGLGSYMSVAVSQDNYAAMARAIVAMVADDRRPRSAPVAAGRRLGTKVSRGGRQQPAGHLVVVPRLAAALPARQAARRHRKPAVPLAARRGPRRRRRPASRPAPALAHGMSLAGFTTMVVVLGIGAVKLVQLVYPVNLEQWGNTVSAAFITLGRVLASTAIGTLWAVPAGLAIGLSPRQSRVMQPILQVLASFPAPMLFPLVVLILHTTGIPLSIGSILLMLLGTQWYILFNVVAGAMAIPADLRETAHSFRLGRVQRFWQLYAPAIFPYLVTGWVTAAGGAWNASIVSEYVVYQGQPEWTHGIGAQISLATSRNQFGLLAASTIVMALVVVTFNQLVWRRLYQLAEQRFSLSK